jgi:hypothetical protein
MKWILKISLFLVCFFVTAKVCKTQTGKFTVMRITSNLTPRTEWETTPLSSDELTKIKQILNQSFSYLSKGVQSFVFASEDGQYVIKFFRHDHLTAPFWLTPSAKAKREQRLHREFLSYKIAFENLRQETGLVFLHLNKTTDLHRTLDLVDKLGIHHKIPLDKYEFLVQKRACLLYTALNQMIENNKIADAKETLTGLVQLLAHRSREGISDKDPDLETNFGVIGTEPIQIDVGRFGKIDAPFSKDEIIRVTDRLHQYLMKRCPELDQHLKTQIEKL